jgi:hypothetical protein
MFCTNSSCPLDRKNTRRADMSPPLVAAVLKVVVGCADSVTAAPIALAVPDRVRRAVTEMNGERAPDARLAFVDPVKKP